VLSTLLTQFRQRHPQGSLTSDLLTIHDGLYVVRVCAAVEGTVLACGLGANTNLELAEDLATTRALERLGVSPFNSPLPAAAIASPPPAPAPSLTSIEPTPGDIAPSLTLVEPTPDDLDPPLTYSELELAAEDLAIPPATQPPLLTSPTQGSLTQGTPTQDGAPIPLEESALAPIDLSDIIAQTDVELQRLGWGVTQGREFLEKTYGKRSRHDLTDDELLEFLLFLETQSPLPHP
jgi:hypothetical protein